MSDRRDGLVVVAVFGLALGLRVLPLAWSPYPATLDGIGYAGLARDALATGHLPLGAMRADNLVFTTLLAAVGAVLDLAPLRAAQPTVAVVGAASVVAAVAVVHRFGRDLGFEPPAVRLASVTVGLGLAVDGLYLRRTGVPDEEALAFLLLPVLVVALHRWHRTGARRWLVPVGVLLVAFPLTHTFSTLVAGTTLVAWLVAVRGRHRAGRLAAVVLVGGFWGYFALYYAATARLGFVVPYVDRVTAHPGLFLAWLVAMAAGVRWFQGAGPRGRRLLLVSPVVVMVGVVLANAIRPVFPGTAASPGLLPVVLGAFVVLPVLAALAVEDLDPPREGAVVLLALLAAPLAVVGFSLTAAVTPEFMNTAMRAQTFAHLPFVALAAIGLAAVGRTRQDRRSRLVSPVALLALLLAALLLTTPVAYVDLDTLAFPSTTTESEFRAASFAAEHVDGPWTSDHVLTRIAVHYLEGQPSLGPTATWLGGGPPPGCPALVATSWTTTGAHLFPAGPRRTTTARYDRLLAHRHLVYAAGGGYDGFALSLPVEPTVGC